MKPNRSGCRRPIILFIVALVCLLAACDDSPAPAPFAAHERVGGEIELTDETAVHVRNPIGPVQINGEGLGPVVRWFLDKEVTAPDPDSARAALAHIALSSITTRDTLAVAITAPPSASGISYASLLSLGLPARINCAVEQALGEARVSYLIGDLVIANGSSGPVTVIDHTGSCRIASGGGDVHIRIELPPAASCIVATGRGEIVVEIPTQTSAVVVLHTVQGAIGIENLVLTDVVQTATSLHGVLGSGAGSIILETARGDIELRGF